MVAMRESLQSVGDAVERLVVALEPVGREVDPLELVAARLWDVVVSEHVELIGDGVVIQAELVGELVGIPRLFPSCPTDTGAVPPASGPGQQIPPHLLRGGDPSLGSGQ